jgi:predicted Zn-dependent peptidase
LDYRRTQQVHLSIGVPALSMTDPDRHALDLLSVVLGEGMSSRLFLEVREKRGLAYDVHSEVVYFQDCGALIVNAGADPAQAYTAVEACASEMGRLKEGIPVEEVERGKRLVAGRLLLRMEDNRAVAAWMAGQELLLGGTADVDHVIEHMNAVTADDVAAVANRLLTSEKLNMAVVGPLRGRKRLEKILRDGLS